MDWYQTTGYVPFLLSHQMFFYAHTHTHIQLGYEFLSSILKQIETFLHTLYSV